MLSEDGSIEIGFGIAITSFGFIAPLFKSGNIWQNMASVDTVAVIITGIVVIAYGRYLRQKSLRESDERIRRLIEEHEKHFTSSSDTDEI
jgi:xanthine/uracil permease